MTDRYSAEDARRLDIDRQQAFRISVTIEGKNGESLFGYGTEPFDSPNLPESIRSIYLTNITAYHGVTGKNPLNGFTLSLDFSTPPLLDSANPVSDPTPNFSNLAVEGDRGTWVAPLHDAVMGVLNEKFNARRMLHAAFVYDIGLFLLGLPVALHLCWRFSERIEGISDIHSTFVSVAVYIYMVLLMLVGYRVLFGYTKWAFPAVEMEENKGRSRTHRRVWLGIVVSLIANIAYDFF